MSRILVAALFGAVSLTACAQSQTPPAASAAAPAAAPTPAAPADAGPIAGATPDERVRNAMARLDPKFKPNYIGAAPFAGFREVLVGGQVLYVSDDGRYLLQAQPYDLQTRSFAASEGLLAYRRKLLATAPVADRIVFAPPAPKYVISVFTDIECGYCRKLHSEIGELNKRGIAIEYLAYPRMGLGSQDYKDMVSVWCAADRRKALTDAKNDRPVPAKSCTTPVNMQYALGGELGVNGTPAIYAADGTQLGGYLPPDKMLEALQKLGPAAAGTAGGSL